MSAEETIVVKGDRDTWLRASGDALASQGFKKIRVSQLLSQVTADYKRHTDWIWGDIILTLRPGPEGHTSIHVKATANTNIWNLSAATKMIDKLKVGLEGLGAAGIAPPTPPAPSAQAIDDLQRPADLHVPGRLVAVVLGQLVAVALIGAIAFALGADLVVILGVLGALAITAIIMGVRASRQPTFVPGDQPAQLGSPGEVLLPQLEALGELRDSGVLTSEEFDERKARILRES